MDWGLISKYDNDNSKTGGSRYKKRFARLPTVDHAGDAPGDMNFRICSWRTNDSKSDLTMPEFVELCRRVLRHNGGETLTRGWIGPLKSAAAQPQAVRRMPPGCRLPSRISGWAPRKRFSRFSAALLTRRSVLTICVRSLRPWGSRSGQKVAITSFERPVWKRRSTCNEMAIMRSLTR